MTDIHSCSYYCDRPECIKAQRDELRERLAQPEQQPEIIKFGHIFEDEDGVLVMKDFRINANKSTNCHELILLNAVINRLLNERDEYTDKEKNNV